MTSAYLELPKRSEAEVREREARKFDGMADLREDIADKYLLGSDLYNIHMGIAAEYRATASRLRANIPAKP